jgi:hypothetical protein
VAVLEVQGLLSIRQLCKRPTDIPAAIDRPHFAVCKIPCHCVLHEDTVVVPSGADCICASYLYRTFRVGKEVA